MLAGYEQLLRAAERLRWDADAIDLRADAPAVRRLGDDDRATLTALVSGFWVAEHAVAAQLQPFVAASAADAAGPPAARACFARQAVDEARHARFIDRVATEVLALDAPALHAAAPEPLRELFQKTLPARARQLAADTRRMPAAVALYHLALEGIVFAIGQDALLELTAGTDMPGVHAGATRIVADERWHVGLGVLHLQRLGAPFHVSREAAAAAAAWGPALATPERVARVMSAHGRRLAIAKHSHPATARA